jgi:hypothetical protein
MPPEVLSGSPNPAAAAPAPDAATANMIAIAESLVIDDEGGEPSTPEDKKPETKPEEKKPEEKKPEEKKPEDKRKTKSKRAELNAGFAALKKREREVKEAKAAVEEAKATKAAEVAKAAEEAEADAKLKKTNIKGWIKKHGLDIRDIAAGVLDGDQPAQKVAALEHELETRTAEQAKLLERLEKAEKALAALTPKEQTPEEVAETTAQVREQTFAKVKRAHKKVDPKVYPLIAAQDGDFIAESYWNAAKRIVEEEGRVPDLDELFDNFEVELKTREDEETKKAIAKAEQLGYTKAKSDTRNGTPPNGTKQDKPSSDEPDLDAVDPDDEDAVLRAALRSFQRAGTATGR